MENTFEFHKKDNAERIDRVINERIRQTTKFGERKNQHPFVWITVLTEEVGECAKSSLEMDFEHLKKELIEVAAVALATIKDLDDNGTDYLTNH